MGRSHEKRGLALRSARRASHMADSGDTIAAAEVALWAAVKGLADALWIVQNGHRLILGLVRRARPKSNRARVRRAAQWNGIVVDFDIYICMPRAIRMSAKR